MSGFLGFFIVFLFLISLYVLVQGDSAEAANLLINQLHSFQIDPGDFGVIAHGCRIVLSDDAFRCSLYLYGRCPRLEDVFRRVPFQHGQIMPDKVAVWVASLAESNGTIAVKKLLKKRGARHPHPRTSVDGPIHIQHVFVKYLHAVFPG